MNLYQIAKITEKKKQTELHHHHHIIDEGQKLPAASSITESLATEDTTVTTSVLFGRMAAARDTSSNESTIEKKEFAKNQSELISSTTDAGHLNAELPNLIDAQQQQQQRQQQQQHDHHGETNSCKRDQVHHPSAEEGKVDDDDDDDDLDVSRRPSFGSRKKKNSHWDDVLVGQMLGRGAFNQVHEVRLERSKPGESLEINDQLRQRQSWFALKRMRSSIRRKGRPSFVRIAEADLHNEGKILSGLNHPNIIRPVSCLSKDEEKSLEKGSMGRFLLLERLHGTIEDKLRHWRLEEQRSTRRIFFPSRQSSQNQQVCRRQLEIGLPIAEAMKHLHSRRIIFRDLKPDNVGYDMTGCVKLFDFGLAREMPEDDDDDDHRRRLTQKVGSYRYMSPEVYKGTDYGLSADVYSYALWLWQISTLQKPFSSMTLADLENKVYNGKLRPKVNRQCGSSPRIRQLLQQCWDENPTKRPSFVEICQVLTGELASGRQRGQSESRSRRLLDPIFD